MVHGDLAAFAKQDDVVLVPARYSRGRSPPAQREYNVRRARAHVLYEKTARATHALHGIADEREAR